MKKGKLMSNLLKVIVCSFSVFGFFACESDGLGGNTKFGRLRLNLTADTTGIKGGTVSTRANGELDEFRILDDYTIQVVAGTDTIKSVLYKDFPEEMSINQGEYTLRAFKGSNQPAAFDNPFFEGTRDFTIKEGMKTPLEVTCSMANARIKAEYGEDFQKAYTDYTVMLETKHLDGKPFLISKEEKRFAYLQTDAEGTPLTVAISLKRASWTEAKVYTVADQDIILNPKESVTLKFATDGKTGDGLSLSIVLDDRLTEVELKDTVPDFMWKPFDKPTLKPQDFVSGSHIQISSAGLDVPPYLAFGVPSGIGNFHIWRTETGSNDTVKYDIATSSDATSAIASGFDWGGTNLFNFKKTAQLQLEKAFKKLPYIGLDKEYEFIFFIKDNLPVTNYTDTIHLFVQKVYAAPTIKLQNELPAEGILEGETLRNDLVANLEAEAGIKNVFVVLTDAGGKETKYTKEQFAELGASLALTDNDTKGVLTFKKDFVQKLNALADTDQSYKLAITVEAKEGIESALSTTANHTLTIKCPKFEWAMAPNEGDVFAKYAVLKVNMPVGIASKLKLQKKENGQWVNLSSINEMKDGIINNTLKNLTPATAYTVRAVYENEHNRSIESTFTTEEAKGLVNGDMEDWNNSVFVNGYKSLTALSGKISIYDYYPWNIKERWWSSNNKETVKEISSLLPPSYISYRCFPMVYNTSDKYSGQFAVEIRSVGAKDGNTADIMYDDSRHRGCLYLSSSSGDDGRVFNSRPSKLKFYYKYAPVGDDNYSVEVEIKNGDEIISSSNIVGGSTNSIYMEKVVDLNYLKNIKATSISIRFYSSMDDNPSVNKKVDVSTPKGTYNIHTGSCLKIDDIELIYE